MAESIDIQRLGETWFEQPSYRPRVTRPGDGQDRWFLLEPPFLPPRAVPDSLPPGTPVAPAPRRAAFEATYETWHVPRPPAVDAALEKVELPEVAMFIAGQQPGFLGGPLYTIYKALSALACARSYQKRTGRPAVAVFWVASEDHDVDEVRTARVPGQGGSEIDFTFTTAGDRRELWRYAIDSDANAVLDAAAAHFAKRRHADAVHALIDSYRGGQIASGFARVLTRLLGDEGLLVLDPVQVRRLTQPLIRRVLTQAPAVLEAIEDGRAAVEAAGREPVVGGRFPLFLVEDGKRHHLSPADGGFRSGHGTQFSVDELLEMLEATPEQLSTGALLRPLAAQYALPCLLTIGGPAEVGYFAQLEPLARRLEVPLPRIALRAGATLLDGRVARALDDLRQENLGPLDLARAAAPEELAREAEDLDALDAFEKLATDTEQRLRRLVEAGPEHPRAPRLLRKTESIGSDIRKVGQQLDRFRQEERGPRLERARKLWNFVYPEGSLQERRWSVLDFVSRHGVAWLGELLKELENDPLGVDHLWVTFLPGQTGSGGGGEPSANEETS